MIECDGQIELGRGQNLRQQPLQRHYVAQAVGQDLLALFRREGRTGQYAIAHRVFLLGGNGVESEISERTD
jgi:hypothetical protein